MYVQIIITIIIIVISILFIDLGVRLSTKFNFLVKKKTTKTNWTEQKIYRINMIISLSLFKIKYDRG